VIREYLSEYVNSVFPDVFRVKPFFTRMYNELIKNHRYIYLLTTSGKGTDNKRILTGIQLLTTQSMIMFLLAVFYDLEGPEDDGTCEFYETNSTCLEQVSILDYSQTYCTYDTDTDICSYKEPEFSWKSIALIGVIIAFTTCIFSSPIDILFDILSSPTKLGKTRNQIKPILSTSTENNNNNSIIEKIKNVFYNSNNYTAINVSREVPFETDNAYNVAKQSMSVASEIININKTKHANDIVDMKKQVIDTNFFSDDIDDIEEIDLNSEPKTSFDYLVDDINNQRRMMDIDTLNHFDDDWGLDPTGSFSKKTVFDYKMCRNITIDTEELLRKELSLVECETDIKLDKFKYLKDKHIGLEMLHTFILDLLGHDSITAKIFITKSDEDYRYTKPVSAQMKGFASIGVIIMNLFFVYYSMMSGMIRGKTWQYAYLTGCIAQILFEIIIAETFEILWVHFFIPNLVSNEVKSVWTTIMNTIDSITTFDASNIIYCVNAPQYLFISNKLAHKYPSLPESNIITAYHNHLPGQIARNWRIDRSYLMGLNGNNNTWIRFVSFTTITTVLKFLGASPVMIQRMIIRITTPLITAATAFMGLYIYENPIYMSLIGVVCIGGVYRICKNRTNDDE